MKHQQYFKWYRTGFLCVTSLTLTLAGFCLKAGAVDPGWNTGDDISQTTGSYDDGTISAPIINDSGVSSNNNQHSGSISAPVIGGGSAGSVGNNSGYQAVSSSSDVDNSNSVNNSNNQKDNGQSNNANQSDIRNESSASSSSSQSSSESHKVVEYHESKANLKKFAKETYENSKQILKAQNDQRVSTNNSKGANQLRSAYLLRLKQIRSGKIDKQTRDRYINQQKSALQQALSQRLAALQTDYDNGQKQVRAQVKSLPDDHAHDAAAMQLDNDLANLDYQLGEKSNRAYTRYNRSVNKLLAQTAKIKHSERSKQRRQAKSEYQANLNAVEALDPLELKQANRQRMRHLKSLYEQIDDQIDNGEITTKSQISNKLDL